MEGYIAPPAGEPCPAVVPAPFRGVGGDITSNSVVCCVYKLPDKKPHITKLLPGAVEEVSRPALRCAALHWEGEREAGRESSLQARVGLKWLGLACQLDQKGPGTYLLLLH